MAASEQHWQTGDRVFWAHESPGGYGYMCRVAAVVDRPTQKRVRIRTALRSRAGGWSPVFRVVKPDSLSARAEYVEAVDASEHKG